MNAISAFELPDTGAHKPPAIASARACRDWLAEQPLANAVQAQAQLLRQVNLLNRFTLAAAERLKILELLRDPVAYAQSESARKFSGRPLPLAAAEQAGLDANRALWQAMQTGFLHCLSACLAGEGDIRPHAALVAQRAIASLRAELIDLFRVPVDPPASLWQTLHRVFAAAETLGATRAEVTDSLQAEHPGSSVTAAYAQTLLLNRASPYELSTRQLLQVERWLHRWGGKVAVSDAPRLEPKAPPLIVDLDSDRPEVSLPAVGGTLRWLDLDDLARSIKRRIVHLQRGESPASLKLGDDCPQPGCEKLLRHLHQYWFKGGAARVHPRYSANGACLLVTSLDAIHYYVSGKPFRQPGHATDLTKLEREQIATFGRISTRHQDDFSEMHGFMIETWQVLDESASGFRLARPLTQAGGRVGGGQLLAARNDTGFLLAVARWTRIAEGKEIQAGIQVLPGAPQAVLLRGTGLTAVNDKYRPGFLLPAVEALKEPATAIIPAGWFRAGRLIEVYVEASRQLRMTRLLERGTDFERVEYEAP